MSDGVADCDLVADAEREADAVTLKPLEGDLDADAAREADADTDRDVEPEPGAPGLDERVADDDDDTRDADGDCDCDGDGNAREALNEADDETLGVGTSVGQMARMTFCV